MKSIRFSTEANRDIEEIANYIFDLNPVAAYRFLDALDETCELLAEHSLIGRLRPTLGENLRSFPVGNFLVFYTPASDGIDVIRVVYGGRDLPGVFQK
jgi:toxin ParE1/3/4